MNSDFRETKYIENRIYPELLYLGVIITKQNVYQDQTSFLEGMRLGRLIVILIVIFVLFSFLVPVFPVTSQSGSFFGASYQVDADVSLTFLISHCGSYVNAHSSASFGGITITHPISNGYNFQCSFSTSG